jgi:sulfite exporter TauE/SafE
MNELFIIVIAGFSIGLLGSFHCVGMCGPLALSLPVQGFSNWYKSIAITFYNLGRSVSYTLMGLLFGILGQSLSLFKLQQYLSIAAGIFILAVLLFNHFGKSGSSALITYSANIKSKLSKLLKSDKTIASYLSIGIVNGFLPCGLVYIAIATAVATGNILESGLLMFAFGIGTIPLMALTMVFGKYVPMHFRHRLNKLTPYLIAGVAILLILRGSNLGIPYLSPTQAAHQPVLCH